MGQLSQATNILVVVDLQFGNVFLTVFVAFDYLFKLLISVTNNGVLVFQNLTLTF